MAPSESLPWDAGNQIADDSTARSALAPGVQRISVHSIEVAVLIG
jgi:hypothetical protein